MNTEQKMNIAPFQSKGRWYQIFVENDAGTYKITTADEAVKNSVISDNTITLPADLVTIDIKCECVGVAGTTGSTTISHTDNTTVITLPSGINYCTLYIFGYFM